MTTRLYHLKTAQKFVAFFALFSFSFLPLLQINQQPTTNNTNRKWNDGRQVEALEFLSQQENKGALVDMLSAIQINRGGFSQEVQEAILSALVGLVSTSFEE